MAWITLSYFFRILSRFVQIVQILSRAFLFFCFNREKFSGQLVLLQLNFWRVLAAIIEIKILKCLGDLRMKILGMRVNEFWFRRQHLPDLIFIEDNFQSGKWWMVSFFPPVHRNQFRRIVMRVFRIWSSHFIPFPFSQSNKKRFWEKEMKLFVLLIFIQTKNSTSKFKKKKLISWCLSHTLANFYGSEWKKTLNNLQILHISSLSRKSLFASSIPPNLVQSRERVFAILNPMLRQWGKGLSKNCKTLMKEKKIFFDQIFC